MNSYEVNRNGMRKVEAELLRRGASSVTLTGKRKSLLSANNSDNSRTVEIRVKTKRKGNWNTTINEAKELDKPLEMKMEGEFWVFVDMGGDTLRYWIAPGSWIRNDIFVAHERYLEKHDGHRPKNDSSVHHSIDENRLEKWRARWDILGIF